jgi:CO/xanthine dehydrogenase Mo-binding subunit
MVDWAAGDASKVSEQDILDYGARQIAAPRGGALVVDDPEVESAFRAAASTLERTYTTNSVLHAQLEPVNALAFEKDGRFEIHTGSQAQSTILPVLARALGLAQDRIILRTYLLGGAFGRRLNTDYAIPAALAAKALDKPVKLVLTREDDTRFDSFRSPSIQKLRLAFDVHGKVTAMEHHASAGWPTSVYVPPRPCRRRLTEPIRSIRHRWRGPLVQRWGATRTRARERPCKSFVSPWLSASGGARVD